MSVLSPRAVYVASVSLLAKDLNKAVTNLGTACHVVLHHDEIGYELLPQQLTSGWRAGPSPVYASQKKALRFVIGDGDVAAVSDAQLQVELKCKRNVTAKGGLLSCMAKTSEVEEVCCSAVVRLQDVMLTAGMTRTYAFDVQQRGKLEVEVALSKPVPGRHVLSLRPELDSNWMDHNEEPLYSVLVSTGAGHSRSSPIRKRARQSGKDVLADLQIQVQAAQLEDEEHYDDNAEDAVKGTKRSKGTTRCRACGAGLFHIELDGFQWGQFKVTKWSSSSDADVLADSCDVELANGQVLSVKSLPSEEAGSYSPATPPVRVDALCADSPSSTSSSHNKIFPDVAANGTCKHARVIQQWNISGSLRSVEDEDSTVATRRFHRQSWSM